MDQDQEVFNWVLAPEFPGDKHHCTAWKMTRAEASRFYPGAVCLEDTRELRRCESLDDYLHRIAAQSRPFWQPDARGSP